VPPPWAWANSTSPVTPSTDRNRHFSARTNRQCGSFLVCQRSTQNSVFLGLQGPKTTCLN
jgi:hypothetical protein